MRAVILTCLLLVLGAPAVAEECPDLDRARSGAIEAHWPGAKYIVYENADSEAIERGIARVGGVVPDGDRVWIVISRPEWKDTVRIVGFVGGCYEDHIDVQRRTLDNWLAGQEVQTP